MNTTEPTNGKTLIVRAAKKTIQPDNVEIDAIEFQRYAITIVSLQECQLIVNNFGPKGAQQMEDERSLTTEERLAKKKGGKPAITPAEIERRFQNARVLDSKGRDC